MTPPETHSTDFIAEKVAKKLLLALDNPSVLIIGNINRDDIDLNRKASRKTEFREYVRRLSNSECRVIIDVHSFPNGSANYGDMDTALVSPNDKPTRLERALLDAFDEAGIDSMFVGNEKADIYVEATKHGKPVVLVEFNERLTDTRVHAIVDVVSTTIVRYFFAPA
jgi:hypothetical protein